MSRNTLHLVAVLDMSVDPPAVKDVRVSRLNHYPAYNCHRDGPYAVLTQITAPSPNTAETAMRGLLGSDTALAWTLAYSGVHSFLHAQDGVFAPPHIYWKEQADKAMNDPECRWCRARKTEPPENHEQDCCPLRKAYSRGHYHRDEDTENET